MISTRGRYAIRVLLDMAEHRGAGYVPLRMIAHRQEISLKYIEQVMPLLTGAGMVEGIHGRAAATAYVWSQPRSASGISCG